MQQYVYVLLTYLCGAFQTKGFGKKFQRLSAYTASNITVLEGLEPVRLRPGMFVGSTDQQGLNQLIFEALDNCIDEAFSGFASRIVLTLLPDRRVSIEDNGRGIPVDYHIPTKSSALEAVLGNLHSGAKFKETGGYEVSGGLHGVGISVINALSSSLRVYVRRDKVLTSLGTSRGLICEPLKQVASKKDLTGTYLEFTPDYKIFGDDFKIAVEPLITRMNEIAVLFPNLDLYLIDNNRGFQNQNEKDKSKEFSLFTENTEVTDQSIISAVDDDKKPTRFLCKSSLYNFELQNPPDSILDEIDDIPKTLKYMLKFKQSEGINGFIKNISKNQNLLHSEPIQVSFHNPEKKPTHLTTNNKNPSIIKVDLSLLWTQSTHPEKIISFVNGINTSEGGVHCDSLRASITKALNVYKKKSEKSIAGEFLREGLVAVLAIQTPQPQFVGQTKKKLSTPGLRTCLDPVLFSGLVRAFEWQTSVVSRIHSKAEASQEAAMRAKASSRDRIVPKTTQGSHTLLPGKLTDCVATNNSSRELFIVEGSSAAGSAKQARDRETQAVLPLRGKILNIEKTKGLAKINENEELKAVMTALGLGPMSGGASESSSCDLSKLRYGKVIIMADADVDGAHIRVLLLTFLYRYERRLFENGKIYVAKPPLFRVTEKNGNVSYSWDQNIDKSKNSIKSKQRFKGLGEMLATQLWDTTMNPQTRKLCQITLGDAQQISETFKQLMGDEAAGRRTFISENAHSLGFESLDL